MKKNKLFITVLLSFAYLYSFFPSKIFAQDNSNALDIDLSSITVNDVFKLHDGNEYRVTQVNESKIYIDGENQNIYSFEINTKINNTDIWRKFVKLEDLCKNENVCTILDKEEYIELKRTNSMSNKIYKLTNTEKSLETFYRTVYDFDKKEFTSLFTIGEDNYKFNYDNSEDSKFSSEGVLTSDVEALKDKNNNIYVSLRFVTESLGAEVKWTASTQTSSDRVDINFYDNDNYSKTIITSLNNMCENVEINDLESIKKCDESDSECKNDRCKTYIKNNMNNDIVNNFEINYNYIDDKGNLKKFKAEWNKENIYTDKNSSNSYGIILYKSVPLIIDIFDGIEMQDKNSEKTKCLMEGNIWVDDENTVKLNGKGEFCSINLDEQITTSASK